MPPLDVLRPDALGRTERDRRAANALLLNLPEDLRGVLLAHIVYAGDKSSLDIENSICQTNKDLRNACKTHARGLWKAVLDAAGWSGARDYVDAATDRAVYDMLFDLKKRDAALPLRGGHGYDSRPRALDTLLEFNDDTEKIDHFAFQWCPTLNLKQLPPKVTTIGFFAFQGCVKLSLTKLPSGITIIEDGAFHETDVRFQMLPAGLDRIKWKTFNNCRSMPLAADGAIPDQITSIDWKAFEGCVSLNLKKLPSELRKIEDSAFRRAAARPRRRPPAADARPLS